MNTPEDDTRRDGDPVEAILGHAAPRPAPPERDRQAVHDAVRAEWRTLVSDRRRRERRRRFAAAAAVTVAAAIVLLLPQREAVVGPIVARIDASNGTIYRIASDSAAIELTAAESVRVGQIVQTGPDGRLGLTWRRGGSLRLDHATRLEFVDAETVFLQRGRVYFDSEPDARGETANRLVVDTDRGRIVHTGTQFIAETDGDALVVIVREGRVRIENGRHELEADAGQQVLLRGRAPPTVLDAPRHGTLWAWTETVAPRIVLDDRSAYDFLHWVGRQTGLEIAFDSAEAEALAHDTDLIGQMDADPRTELRLRMMTTDLEYTVDAADGRIHVRLADGASR